MTTTKYVPSPVKVNVHLEQLSTLREAAESETARQRPCPAGWMSNHRCIAVENRVMLPLRRSSKTLARQFARQLWRKVDDKDGTAGILNLLALLANWGQCA